MNDELETRMRAVLIALALTSNGRTASYDSSGGTPDYVLVDDRGRAKLGVGDAPHLHHAAQWAAAGDDPERRARVVKDAEEELELIRRSHADRSKVETKVQRDRRIIEVGEGWLARDVAVHVRCGITDVHKARQAAGRDVEYGRLPRNGRELSRDELNAEILRLTSELGMSGREIAEHLGIDRSAVRYVLARPPKPS